MFMVSLTMSVRDVNIGIENVEIYYAVRAVSVAELTGNRVVEGADRETCGRCGVSFT